MPTAPRASRQAPPELPESAARVLRRFRIVFNTVKAHFRSMEKSAGMAGAQVWALSVIRQHPGIGVGALAKAMDIHQSTASNLLRPLIEQGFVAADRTLADKRAVHLQLTPLGARRLRKVPGPFTGVLPEALRRLDERTLSRLDKDLAALVELLDGDPRAGKVPLGQSDR
ncbi:MAG TPA: MarR family winged helix-turn-helix transcriptional regulator [Ramlibacter sp.]|nr:MarR family winged helix-turn-helix transcriptional regulator [Ramlibacter sp.]